MSIIIGLTGPTGSGKSYFSELALRQGCFVINCDASARKAAYKGSAMVKELVEKFGESILDSDGELNRANLAALAFADRHSTEKLNKITLPHISKFVKGEITAAEEDNEIIILDAPTLFESGLDVVCDAVVAVLADEKIRLGRITERDSITISDAELRMSAGQTEEFYTNRTSHIIYNNSDIATFEENAMSLLKKITGGIKNGTK